MSRSPTARWLGLHEDEDVERTMDAFYTDGLSAEARRGVPLADFDSRKEDMLNDLKPDTVGCRVCGKPAPRRGPYAGRCDDHKTIASSKLPPKPAEPAKAESNGLVAAAQDVVNAKHELALAQARVNETVERLTTMLRAGE